MILIFNYHRIPTFILHHQLKTAFKNELLKLGMVCFLVFFCFVFLVCYCFFHIRTFVPRIIIGMLAFPSIPMAARGGRPQSGLPSCTGRLQ